MKSIFVFAYYSYKDPVFQSAVLPYFRNLSNGSDLRFVVLTFEQEKYKVQDTKEVNKIKENLITENIIWHQTNWHSGRFKFVKKIFDFSWGILFASLIILRYQAKAIYSEGFPGAVIAHFLANLFCLPHLVHTFEPHTNYMIEAGVWTESSWEARLLKRFELKVARNARYIFTATDAMIQKLQALPVKATMYRVPSCVDTSDFNFSAKDRGAIRKQYHITEANCVVTYLGKFGGMYMDEEIFDFLAVLEQDKSITFRYFILTPDDHAMVYSAIQRRNLNKDKFVVKTLARNEISPYLSASDFGLVPVRQKPSKRFCSPIKDGEYWACGLPIIIPKGISDDYVFAQKYHIGIVMTDTSRSSNQLVLQEIKVWFKEQNKAEVVKRCRKFVLADRSIDNYKSLYKEIFLDV